MSKKNSKQNYSSKSILYIALMRHKKGLLLVILIAMISSSLAWFYNSLSVGMQVQGQVDPWNVSMGDSSIYTIKIDNLKPGVESLPVEGENVIPVRNDGASDAYLSLSVRDIYLFGERLVKEGDTNEDGSPNTNIQYRVDREELISDVDPNKKHIIFKIKGFPWSVDIDFPSTILKTGESENITFTLKWEFNGDTTPVEIEGGGGAKQPTCLSNIIDPTVLNYVETQKTLYSNIGVNVDENDTFHAETPESSEAETNLDLQNRITTCDIIDTYFGEKSVKFQQEKSSSDIIDIDEFYYRRNTDPENIKRPKKDLFIEMSLTVTQVGGQSIDVGEETPSTSDPDTTP